MKVKDLKQALEKFDDDAIVCIEALNDCAANIAKQYTFVDGNKHVYIADNTEYIEEVFSSPIKECVVGYEEV